jgi:hypothetical protein
MRDVQLCSHSGLCRNYHYLWSHSSFLSTTMVSLQQLSCASVFLTTNRIAMVATHKINWSVGSN